MKVLFIGAPYGPEMREINELSPFQYVYYTNPSLKAYSTEQQKYVLFALQYVSVNNTKYALYIADRWTITPEEIFKLVLTSPFFLLEV